MRTKNGLINDFSTRLLVHSSTRQLFGRRAGQTVVETAILVMVLVFAFLAMQTYLKRGIQGRLKTDIDQVGPQYDFRATTSDFTTTHVSNTTSTSSSATVPVPVPDTWGATVDRTVTTSLSQTHYDNTLRQGSEIVANP